MYCLVWDTKTSAFQLTACYSPSGRHTWPSVLERPFISLFTSTKVILLPALFSDCLRPQKMFNNSHFLNMWNLQYSFSIFILVISMNFTPVVSRFKEERNAEVQIQLKLGDISIGIQQFREKLNLNLFVFSFQPTTLRAVSMCAKNTNRNWWGSRKSVNWLGTSAKRWPLVTENQMNYPSTLITNCQFFWRLKT